VAVSEVEADIHQLTGRAVTNPANVRASMYGDQRLFAAVFEDSFGHPLLKRN
jgi:hypothetical protein